MLDKQKVEEDLATNKITSRKQADAKIEALEQQHAQKMKKIALDQNKEELTMLQNQTTASKNTFDGIGNYAAEAAGKARQEWQNFGNTGKTVVTAFQNQGATAFQNFGASVVNHSQSASAILKQFFLGALADIAEAQGKLYLAMGLVDPSKAAAGAALLALSGILRALAGSGSSGSIGGGGGGSSSSTAAATTATTAAAQQPTGNLTVQVMGDYLNTAQTQRTLLQAVRDATDQTGFSYSFVNGNT